MSATPAQRAKIEGLFIQKDVDPALREKIRLLMGRSDATPRDHVSPVIANLSNLPDSPAYVPAEPAEPTPAAPSTPAPGARSPRGGNKGPVHERIVRLDLPHRTYRVDTSTLPPSVRAEVPVKDVTHFKIDEFRETKYLRYVNARGRDQRLTDRGDELKVLSILFTQITASSS